MDGPSRALSQSTRTRPVADLPVLEVVSGLHFIADLTLGLGKVVYNYLD